MKKIIIYLLLFLFLFQRIREIFHFTHSQFMIKHLLAEAGLIIIYDNIYCHKSAVNKK